MIKMARTIPLHRYFLIICLFSAMTIGGIYLFLRYKKAQNVRKSIENLMSAHQNSALIDSCIINLYSADNNSRLYTITGNKLYLQKFSTDLNDISRVIAKLKLDDSQDIANTDPSRFSTLMKEKAEKTGSYIQLRLLTDSLIKSSARINHSLDAIQEKLIRPKVTAIRAVKLDTVNKTAIAAAVKADSAKAKPRKKFFGRVLSVFSGKKANAVPKPQVVTRDTVIYSAQVDSKSIRQNRNNYKNYYRKLNTVNNRLRKNEQQILLINNNLIEEIIASLKLYKAVEQRYVTNSKRELNNNLADVFYEFKKVSVFNFIFLFTLICIVFYNIWKIFRNEQLLIEYSDKAEEYALSKSRFLAGMSHEIRTPLNSVIGFSEQLSQDDLSHGQKEQIAAIRNSSEMLLDLVNEILDFSKYETGKMSFDSAPFIISQTLNEVYTTMHVHALKKGIRLINDIDIDENLCCEGDRLRLKQVIMNLVGNAIKFTSKGSVTIYARADGIVINKKASLRVKIIDSGVGISKDDLPHIFEEFSQVAKAQQVTKHKGTGLGLAICKKIIELQGGVISVSSTPGKGSTFSFELPMKKGDKAELKTTHTLSDSMMAELVRDKYILFTEDNKLNVLLGTTILKKWGIRYDIAYNGREAFDLFEDRNYDVVLTDIEMPEMDGLQLTEAIRNYEDPYKSNICILALTANVLKEDRDLYFKTGVNDVVLKPFLEKDLIEKIALAVQNNVSAMRFIA